MTVYATAPHDLSDVRRRVEHSAERVVDLSGLSDGDAARAINADGVHILVDLNGYTKGARTAVFALRPAPVQVGPSASACSHRGTEKGSELRHVLERYAGSAAACAMHPRVFRPAHPSILPHFQLRPPLFALTAVAPPS